MLLVLLTECVSSICEAKAFNYICVLFLKVWQQFSMWVYISTVSTCIHGISFLFNVPHTVAVVVVVVIMLFIVTILIIVLIASKKKGSRLWRLLHPVTSKKDSEELTKLNQDTLHREDKETHIQVHVGTLYLYTCMDLS